MSDVLTALQDARLEIANPAGSSSLIIGHFDYAQAEDPAVINIAAGSDMHFDKFSRLTIKTGGKSGHLSIHNTSPLLIDVYRETPTERVLAHTLAAGERWAAEIGEGEQLFCLPRTDTYIPPHPLIVEARYNRGNPLTDRDNSVFLGWVYPPEHIGRIQGFNVYKAFYDGPHPIAIHRLNKWPQTELRATIADYGVSGRENHRYAITAVGRNGVESLFSNVQVLDSSSLWGMTDAGMIPL
jgi:hypothetical protein